MTLPTDTKSIGWRSRGSLALIAPAGFIFFALGAFALTMSGGWVWIGALLWSLAGMLATVALLFRTNRPKPQPDRLEAMKAQLKRLDRACEDLQDQNWELREAEQKYRTLLNRQGDIILHIGEDDQIQYANDAYDLHFPSREGGSPFNPDPDALRIDSPQGWDLLWEKGYETRLGKRWFRWTETLMRSTQKHKGQRLVIARDVSAYKKVEAASEAKSRFLTTISHEMRTPLNGIIGMANLLDSTNLTPEQSSYSQAMRQSGTALLALVNDVLDLSRIEADKLTLAHEWTSPRRLVEDVVELLAPDAQEKGLSIACWTGQTVPDKLLIDPARVRQILINLVGNAIKFTTDGAINVSLTCPEVPIEGEDAVLCLAVRDTGPGISEQMQERLFGEFEQADATRSRHHEGTGLGLAISRRLARKMGGDILLASKEGKGSTFTLHLATAWLSDEEEMDGSSARSPADQLAGDLLVGIDLTEADQRALFGYCKDWGMDFHALSRLEWNATEDRLCPDHLLINGVDPDKVASILSGFDPLKGGRLTRPLPKNRVILLEPGERSVIPLMRNCGASAYLLKPVRQASLHLALLGHPDTSEAKETGLSRSMPQQDPVAAERESEQFFSNQAASDALQVLLVDDNDINALLAQRVLEKAGMHVHLARSGVQALELYDKDIHFDIALLDLHMPDMDGIGLFDAMKQSDLVHGRPIPKLAYTADSLEETRLTCLAHGFAAVLVKPVEPSQLVATIKEALDPNADDC